MITADDAKVLVVRAGERGAILVTSLLLLLVLTIIGVSVMQMTRMQERMSGNSSDVNMAFQGAESGLRGAETKILSFAELPKPCSTVGAACNTVFDTGTLGVLNTKDSTFWDDNAIRFSDPNIGSQFDEAPQFVIEELAFIPYTKEYGDLTGRDFYQATGRSTGASGSAAAVVQSTFARQAN
jgi:type IV pilus assembly protein PilX